MASSYGNVEGGAWVAIQERFITAEIRYLLKLNEVDMHTLCKWFDKSIEGNRSSWDLENWQLTLAGKFDSAPLEICCFRRAKKNPPNKRLIAQSLEIPSSLGDDMFHEDTQIDFGSLGTFHHISTMSLHLEPLFHFTRVFRTLHRDGRSYIVRQCP